ncbi:alanine racemase, partial [Thioclava sp. BHET1]
NLPTPCLCIDEARLMANLDRVADMAKDAGVALRPHIKTHKSIRIARAQIARGATGLTASKPEEALIFMRAGIPALTLAYPLLSAAEITPLLAAAATQGTALRLVVDSLQGVHAAATACRDEEMLTEVQIEIDVGLSRCGVNPASADALLLAREIEASSHLSFAGLLSHAGQA